MFGMGTGVTLAPLTPTNEKWVWGASANRKRCGFGVRVCCVLLQGRPGSLNRGTGQASRAISTARLRGLPLLHLRPINVLVSNGPSEVLRPGKIGLGGSFPLRCFQRFSRPDVATRRYPWQNSRYTRGQSVPVLSY